MDGAASDVRKSNAAAELDHWLSEARTWPCTCRRALAGCSRCRVYDALEAAVEHVLASDWLSAYESVRRAARLGGRLDDLCGRLEVLAYPPEGATEAATCSCTAAAHAEIVADAIRREAELVKVGQQHDDDFGVHLQLANHHCGSTLAWRLPEHRVGEVAP